MIGKVRPAVAAMASYTPGKSADQVDSPVELAEVIKVASNENPWSPVPEVLAAIAEAASGVNRYGDNRATVLVGAISEWLEVDRAGVTIGCGSSGLLQQLFMVYVDAGDEVLFPYPSFEIYPIFSTQFGANKVTVPLTDYAFDLDAVAAAITPKTKLIFLATPNNPTGTSVSVDELREFLQGVPTDVIVVIDEAYREFSDPALGDPASLLDDFPNVVITRTFSKAFGLAGMRTGYALCHPEIVRELEKVRLPFSVNNLAQAGALAAIQHRDKVLERVEVLVAERARCAEVLAQSGVSVPPPQANFIFIPTGEETAAIAANMEQLGVITRPFPNFGLRITVGSPEENDRWLHAFLEVHDNE